MYTQFYGLREKPFSLSPDPRYLFLADAHREALAHLLYGIEQGEGFIAVTGEVGTGKTTICRTLLQRLEPGTEVAFIFNPQLSPDELLQSIAAELGLSSAARSRRELLDDLNRFLLAKKSEGRRVLLIIDEAQNLSPETLEQIRLLSNLETDTEKLVQIVLIGQPELDEMLESRGLRQLRQRISVRWRLQPLSSPETREYVRHRLRIAAGAPRELFTELSLREIHRRSRGIPRMINLLCDRALLAGYASGARSIGLGLVTQTEREIRGAGAPLSPTLRERIPFGRIALGAAAAAALVLGFVYGPGLIEPLRGAAGAPPAVASPPPASVRKTPGAPPPAPSIATGVTVRGPLAFEVQPEPLPAPELPGALAAAPPDAVSETEPRPTPDGEAKAEIAAPARVSAAPPAAARVEAAAPEPAPAPAVTESAPAPAVTEQARAPAVTEPAPTPAAAEGGAFEARDAGELGKLLGRTAPGVAWAGALDAALALFGEAATGAGVLAREQALERLHESGLETLTLRGATPPALAWFDRPALVELRASDGTPRTLLLTALDGEEARLAGAAPVPLRVPLAALREQLTGTAHVVWRDYESLPTLLTAGQQGAPVAWLQHTLSRLGFYDRAATGEFDPPTEEAVRAFQKSRSLQADGAVGPLTKMALYEALGRYESPQLRAGGRRG